MSDTYRLPFTLPAEHRPAVHVWFPFGLPGDPVRGEVCVRPDGTVTASDPVLARMVEGQVVDLLRRAGHLPRPPRTPRPEHERLRIEGEWLVLELDEHTCAGGTPESGYAHEPSCGLEPVMKLAELVALFDVIAETGAPINRPAEVVSRIEERGRERGVRPFRELFAGGPDTSCSTTWRRAAGDRGVGALLPRVECVEVPLDDLRAAFAEAGETE